MICPGFPWTRRFPSKGSFKIVLSIKQRYFARSAGSFHCQRGRSGLLSPPCPSHAVYIRGWRTRPQPMTVSAVARKALHYTNVILQNNGLIPWSRSSLQEGKGPGRLQRAVKNAKAKRWLCQKRPSWEYPSLVPTRKLLTQQTPIPSSVGDPCKPPPGCQNTMLPSEMKLLYLFLGRCPSSSEYNSHSNGISGSCRLFGLPLTLLRNSWTWWWERGGSRCPS